MKNHIQPLDQTFIANNINKNNLISSLGKYPPSIHWKYKRPLNRKYNFLLNTNIEPLMLGDIMYVFIALRSVWREGKSKPLYLDFHNCVVCLKFLDKLYD